MKRILLALAMSASFSAEIFSDCQTDCITSCGLDASCVQSCQEECPPQNPKIKALTQEKFNEVIAKMSQDDKDGLQAFVNLVSSSFGEWEKSEEYKNLKVILEKYGIGLEIFVSMVPISLDSTDNDNTDEDNAVIL